MNNVTWQTVLNGLPITTSRGFIGYSSVSLINCGGHLGLFDTGPEGVREILLKSLKTKGINASDIEFVFLSHMHFDHFINVELFPNAKIYTTQEELMYALSDEPHSHGDFNYSTSSIEYFYKKFILLKDGDEVYGGKIINLPGHTKGSIGLEIEDCIFCGDALKYSIEAKMKQTTYAYFDKKLANKSIVKIISSDKTIVPGHDPAFKLISGTVEYLNNEILEIYKRKDSNVEVFLKEI